MHRQTLMLLLATCLSAELFSGPVLARGNHYGWCRGFGNPHQSAQGCGQSGSQHHNTQTSGPSRPTATQLPPKGTPSTPQTVAVPVLAPTAVPVLAPQRTPIATPVAIPPQVPPLVVAPPLAPQATPQATPTPTPVAVPNAVPTPVIAPPLVPQAVPQAVPPLASRPIATPQPIPQAIPQPTAIPTPTPTAVPTAIPYAVPARIPQRIPAVIATPTATPQATPQATPTPLQTPVKTPVPTPVAVPNQVPQAIPQPVANTAKPSATHLAVPGHKSPSGYAVIVRPKPRPAKLTAPSGQTAASATHQPKIQSAPKKFQHIAAVPGRHAPHDPPRFKEGAAGEEWECVASGFGPRRTANARGQLLASGALRHIGNVDAMARGVPARHLKHSGCIISINGANRQPDSGLQFIAARFYQPIKQSHSPARSPGGKFTGKSAAPLLTCLQGLSNYLRYRALSSAGLEQGTSNSQVGGSSPPGLAIFLFFPKCLHACAFGVARVFEHTPQSQQPPFVTHADLCKQAHQACSSKRTVSAMIGRFM